VDTLGRALRQRRGDLSQRAAARELGVAVQTYIWWERDAVTPRLNKVAALAGWLDVSEDEVLRKLHDGEVRALRDREQDRPVVTIPGVEGAYLSGPISVPVLALVA
jgi:transcriptional regulator with XRE-family HTH domain